MCFFDLNSGFIYGLGLLETVHYLPVTRKYFFELTNRRPITGRFIKNEITRMGLGVSYLNSILIFHGLFLQVALPLLVLHGAADQVTDPSISILLHEKAKSKDKTLRLYDDAWHCLLQGEPDPVVEKVMMDILSWLDAHADSNQDFNLESEQEMEHRLAKATSSMIQFGKYNLIEKLL